ncbi:thiopeptide-type bacteriocin biosynthesis protein [Dactylosporangium sp. NPDC048998]|uniref:thiopeptide-type bacteriocin biosynthesis protein n=1 Tax=Dactylosporangium sp. NPDC048998 TaxID=3363976 RepID=UPI003717A334
MPADHLTADPLTSAVLQVLAGAPLGTAAADAGIDPADLADAADTYHEAGCTALQQRGDPRWYQVRIEFSEWDTAERVAATQLGPQLDRLLDTGATSGWWFLRKHPCWRLRIANPDLAAVHQVLDSLTTTGAATRWWPSLYEPETAAFGGLDGIRLVHDLFCADSHGVLHYLRQPQPPLGRREISLLLLGALLHAAGLDWFERGDVFDRVAQLRPAPDTDDHRLPTLIGHVRGLLAVASDPDNALFGPGGPAHFAAPWHTAYTTTGHNLATAAAAGTLHRGLRAITSHIVIFHWNRLGLSAATQGILTRAAREAFLPRS